MAVLRRSAAMLWPGAAMLWRSAAIVGRSAAIVWRSALALRDLKREDIHRASCRCVLLDVLHRADHAERGVRIVGRDLREGDRAHPAADAGIDGDVLLAVRTKIGDRVADDARS